MVPPEISSQTDRQTNISSTHYAYRYGCDAASIKIQKSVLLLSHLLSSKMKTSVHTGCDRQLKEQQEMSKESTVIRRYHSEKTEKFCVSICQIVHFRSYLHEHWIN